MSVVNVKNNNNQKQPNQPSSTTTMVKEVDDTKKRSHDVVEAYESKPDDIQVQVQVIEAKNLYKTDLFGKTNPYMGIYVLNETFPRVKTKVQHKTLNPKYNGTLLMMMINLCDCVSLTVVVYC